MRVRLLQNEHGLEPLRLGGLDSDGVHAPTNQVLLLLGQESHSQWLGPPLKQWRLVRAHFARWPQLVGMSLLARCSPTRSIPVRPPHGPLHQPARVQLAR